MTSSMYTGHLHGIEAVESDVVRSGLNEVVVEKKEGEEVEEGVIVANEDLLEDEEINAALNEVGLWKGERTERISLTFRRVEKVMKGGFGGLLKK